MPHRAFSLPTADLCDEAGLDVSKIPSHKVKIVDPALNFRNFGGRTEFSGQIETIKAYESNPAVKNAFAEKGDGRVLVVDAGGSMRCAMLGDMIAEAGTKNGWAGIVIYGCIRDSKVVGQLPLGVKGVAPYQTLCRVVVVVHSLATAIPPP
jgi:regulator of ribonuclease activity A